MKAVTVRHRDTGQVAYHFTLDLVEIPDEDPFFWPRVWGPEEAQAEDILTFISGLYIPDPETLEPLDYDDGDLFIEGFANWFYRKMLYVAEVVDSPEAVTGDSPPVPA